MITADGIEILNTARRILERSDSACMDAAWDAEDVARKVDLGRTAEAAKVAADAIFNFLNVAHNYGKVDMNEEQLHGKKLLTEEVEVNV